MTRFAPLRAAIAGLTIWAACQRGQAAESAPSSTGAPPATTPPAPVRAAPAEPAPSPGAPGPDVAGPDLAGEDAATYRADLEDLCDALARSGADRGPERDRPAIIAMWLGERLRTRAARAYLVRIQPLTGEPKARALEAEATRVGLAGCALAGAWRTAPPS